MVRIAELDEGAPGGGEAPVVQLDYIKFNKSDKKEQRKDIRLYGVLSVIFDSVPFLSTFRAIRRMSEGVAEVGRPLRRICLR